MTSFALPVVLGFGRVAIENVYQNSKSLLLRPRKCSSFFVSSKRNFGTVIENQKDSNQTNSNPNLVESEQKLKSEIELLNKDIEELKEKNEELDDKYKRALAHSENLRLRLTKQIEDAKLFGIQGFCKDLLDVADILGKATESVPKDEISERNPHLKSLYEGLVMTEAQLNKVFKKHGVISLNPLNERFDPNQHEALFQQEVDGKEPGTVVVVSKVGYKLHERIVRPALVGVAKG
ncbi:PREDICTED: grpE protein homolog 1, mitochondrial [Ceratosolen solmsi marchali]|uniref:GrpE protein homolog n=1 Tax=Ceratosolen solmsi marchali TaxID=326594 RepID=A0AAJ6YEM9_9HYME|nr:PREDICTED: grpE protein homolog 1, mitochondrial [Ceratosolen solmsi marchali]